MADKRELILAKSGGVCWYCGERLGNRWHVDHFLPLVRNPDGSVEYPERDTEENLVPACAPCNLLKSSYDIENFRWLVENFVTRLNRDITVYRHAKRYGLVKETDEKVTFWFEENNGGMIE